MIHYQNQFVFGTEPKIITEYYEYKSHSTQLVISQIKRKRFKQIFLVRTLVSISQNGTRIKPLG